MRLVDKSAGSTTEIAAPAAGARVIFVNRYFSPDLSATSQMLSDLAFALVADGFDVVVVTSRMEYSSPSTQLPPFEHLRGVAVHRVWTSRFGRATLLGRALDYLTFYLSAAARMFMLARPRCVLVAKTDPPLVSVVAALVAWIRGAHLVNWLQDVFPEVAVRLGVLRDRPVSRILRRWRNWTLRRASANVVIGHRMAALVAAEGIAPRLIEIIPNWADGELITPLPRDLNPLRLRWELGTKFVVGYSGNLGRAHDFRTILRAARRLQSNTEIVFLFIGGGSGSLSLRDEVTREGLTNFRFEPYQAQHMLRESLGVPDVHLVSLLPELEGLIVPSKFYGIAAAGRPCVFIGDRLGELAHLGDMGGFGVTIAPEDEESLARLIDNLSNDPLKCSSMGNAARAFFDDRCRRSLSVERWACLLRLVNSGSQ